MIAVQAPGKVVLLGEYAVLDDAPAVVAGVDCGVEGTYVPGPTHQIIAMDDRFVGPALASAPTGTYTFTPWNPAPTPTKPGLGHSAAATVAAVMLATMARRTSIDPDHLFARAASVHHRVQGGGSGIDIAASTFGGVLQFEHGITKRLDVDLTDRLGIAWAGTSADTASRVAIYRASMNRSAFVQRSAALVQTWQTEPIGAFAEAADLLLALDRAIGLGWWIDAYGPLLSLARDCGGAAKPSGAGGGDVVVGVFPDRDRRDAWLRAVPRAGAIPLFVSIAPGVCFF